MREEIDKINYELSGTKPIDSKDYDLRDLRDEDNNQRFVRVKEEFRFD